MVAPARNLLCQEQALTKAIETAKLYMHEQEFMAQFGPMLANQGIFERYSAKDKVESIRQRGVPLPEPEDLTPDMYIDALMKWSEYEAAAAWRGTDGVATQLKSIRPSAAKKSELLDWIATIRQNVGDVLASAGGTFFEVLSEIEAAVNAPEVEDAAAATPPPRTPSAVRSLASSLQTVLEGGASGGDTAAAAVTEEPSVEQPATALPPATSFDYDSLYD